MKKRRLILLSTVVAALVTGFWLPQNWLRPNWDPNDPFVQAIENRSTSPSYILITVVDDNTNAKRVVCTVAPFLLGAIQRERQISYDDAASSKVMRIALTQKDRIFHFTRAEALKNIAPRYDEKILAEMRAALENFPDAEVANGFRQDGKGLDKLYREKPAEQRSAYRDAIAHVLMERGFWPGLGDLTGAIYISK